MQWNKVTLVGVGLLGGSLGLALKERKLARNVTGFVRRAASLDECKKAGAVDLATLDLREAVADSDLLVLCTPLAQMQPLVKQMRTWLRKGAIITDVGSVKGSVVRDLESLVARTGAHFVGSHPMAGAEKTGVAAARRDLFESALCVVTPTPKSNRVAVRKIEALWKSVGARVLSLNPGAHDELVSYSSHLPHFVAATLANGVLAPTRPKEQGALCANGFRDTTRVASGSPEMWRDIAVANRKHLGRALAGFIRELQKVKRLVADADARRIEQFLEQARSRREEWRQIAPQRGTAVAE